MNAPRPESPRTGLVHVIDDDPRMRASLHGLLRSAGLRPACFASASEFLAGRSPERPACLLLDVRLPEVNGLDLQQVLAHSPETALPTIIITGHADVRMGVRAMKAGAVDFLAKPFDPAELLQAIQEALARDAEALGRAGELAATRAGLRSLTPRERDVLDRVVAGRLNKQIAGELGVSEVTVKVHRRRVMEKMKARSLAELVRCMTGLSGTKPAQ